MVSLNPRKQHYYIATFQLLLAGAFIVAIHSDCDVPPRFNFAELKEEYRHEKTFAVDRVVDYNCRPGYGRVLKSTLRCMRNSQWSGNREFCKAKSCAHPGDPENGRLVILTDLTFGATVNFTCEEGYRLIGSAQRKCILEGLQVAWDRDIPFCQSIPCLPPPEVEHGRHTGMTLEEFNYGTSVTYQCDTVARGQVPFSLIGEASIHCTSPDNVNGEWSGPAPECKAIRCQQPTVDHGKQVTGYSPIYTYNSFIMFECDSRYTLKGSNVLKCNENNRWAPQLPLCERSSCDDPPRILNTLQNSSNSQLFPAGTVVKYDCERGYELIPGISSAIVTCQKDFTWSEHQDFCQKKKCPYPYVNNGKETLLSGWRKETYVYGDRIKIQCNNGYILKNHDGVYGDRWPHGEWITCGDNGAWNRPIPVCEPACGTPPVIYDGWPNLQKNIFPVGSVVTYSCKKGWSFFRESFIRCIGGDGITAHWQGPFPECKEILCSRPHIENGTHEIEIDGDPSRLIKYKLGVSIKFTCNPGYNLKGYSRSKCVENGTWDHPLPSCSLGSCSNPPTFENAERINLGEFLVGTRVTYFCKPGYALIPGVSPNVTCLKNFTWSKVSELCQKKKCPYPYVNNGKETLPWSYERRKETYVYGDRIKIQCNDGYILKNHDGVYGDRWPHGEWITCGDNGAWNRPIPVCEPVCESPPDIDGGRPNLQKDILPVGSVVTYSCNKGWSFFRERFIRCISGDGITAHWQGPFPECKEILCSRPHIENGTHEIEIDGDPSRLIKYKLGVSVKFTCNPGYNLKGSNRSKCVENGTWDHPLPSCSLVQCRKPDVQNATMVVKDDKIWYNMKENITFKCSSGYQFSDHWYKSATDSLNITCLADGTWTVLPKCKKQSDAPVCKMVRETRKFLDCGVPLPELKMCLEARKLYLEIQKLKWDLRKRQ